MVETAGVEPAFSPCKDDVLPLNYIPWRWSGRQDLNLRLHAPKACALPGCVTPRHCGIYGNMAEGVGFEPTGDIMPPAIFKTAALNRSAILPMEPSYGAGVGTRTPTLRITNPLLCQLGHTGMRVGRYVTARLSNLLGASV